MATEPTSTTGAVAAGAAVTAPVLAGFGIDLTTIGAAFLGLVIVQCLMPATDPNPKPRDLKVLIAWSVGSMLFASLATPLLLAWALDNVPYMKALREWQSHALVAGTAGGFAQPLLVFGRFLFGRWMPGPPASPAPKGDKP